MLSYANIQDRVEQYLQDTTNAVYDTTELGYWIEDGLKEYSTISPHVIEMEFQIESRHGNSSATSANNLVDSNKGQFVAGDVGKVVYNDTDKTWAVVETYTDANTLALSADIFTSGEAYYIYDKRCRNDKQIYIGGAADTLKISELLTPIRAEYPCNYFPRRWRTIRLSQGGEVLELQIDFNPDDSDPNDTNSRTLVIVEFNKTHVLSQLTDWSGELTADASLAATSIAIDGMGAAEVIEAGEEFHLQNHRSLYVVTEAVTMSSGAGTVKFYPGLEAAATDNDDIEFAKSTLKPEHEVAFAKLVASKALSSEAMNRISAINYGGTDVWNKFEIKTEKLYQEAMSAFRRDVKPKSKGIYARL